MIDQFLDVVCHGDARNCAWNPCLRGNNTGIVQWEQKFPYGKKTRPGRCTEQELIALRTSMIIQAREVFCQGRVPASLI